MRIVATPGHWLALAMIAAEKSGTHAGLGAAMSLPGRDYRAPWKYPA